MLVTKRNAMLTMAKLAALPFALQVTAQAWTKTATPVWVMDKQPLLTGLHAPVGMAFDSQQNLYIANWGNGTITRWFANGKREVFASDLHGPSGLALGANDDVFVASYADDVVWRIKQNGKRTLFVDKLATPAGLSFEVNGNLLIANRRTNQILSANRDGKISVVAHDLHTPVGSVRAKNGQLFVANIDGGISVVDAQGQPRSLTNTLHRPGPGIALAAEDAVYVVDYGGTCVYRVSLAGEVETIVDGLSSPVGLLRAPNGDLLLTTWGENSLFRLRQISL